MELITRVSGCLGMFLVCSGQQEQGHVQPRLPDVHGEQRLVCVTQSNTPAPGAQMTEKVKLLLIERFHTSKANVNVKVHQQRVL